ncbi:MAG: DUF3857 domain-containing protein [Lentisphaeria bacterium]|nr:DUF3857 domain-containing protein [Lentisphaeria bacterium]
MKIANVLLAMVLGLLPFAGFAALEKAELQTLSEKATVKIFPQADRVLLHDVETHIYQPDGLGTVTDECYEKILTDKGREAMRSLSLQYSTHYRKVEIPLVEVIRPDGSVRKIDVAANSREAISTGSMGANIYDPAGKVLTVNIPELAVDDIVHYIIRQKDIRVRVPDHWSDIFVLQYDFPILHYEVRVDAPKKLPLQSVVVKDEVKGTLTASRKEEKERIIYTWTAKDVPQVIPEPHMPPLYSCVQRVLVSTAKDWQEISRWYWNLCLPHLKTTPEIKAEVAKITAKCKNDDEKIMALFQFVSQQIRYMGITAETEAPGLEPHDVALTFNNRYGVCRDKAALLTAMLRTAGFNAFPVLFMAGEPKDTEVANSFFNHAIVAVDRGKSDYILMDPTDESTAELLPAYLSNMSYLAARPEGETLLRSPVVPVEKNMLSIRSSAVVSADNELSGRTEFSFGGVNDQLYRDAFSHWSPEEREQFFSRILRRSLPGAELTGVKVLPENIRDMSKKLQVILKYRLPKALNTGSAEFLLPLPEFSSAMGAAALFVERQMGMAVRKFPMRFFSTCGSDEELEISLPPRYRSVFTPEKQRIAVPGLLEFSREYRSDRNILRMKRQFQLCGVEVSTADYRKLKKAFRQIAAAAARPMARLDYPEKMTLQEAIRNFPQSNAVLLDETIRYDLSSSSDWKSEQKFRMLILNYSGVKSYSEIKIPYNPVREKVSVQALVRLPDGTVRKLSEKEINIMDAPWVSQAPRYPAGKLLVASFPGVMPGAVIECTVSRESKGMPFFSVQEPFAADMPIIRKHLSVTAPKELKLYTAGTPANVRMQKSSPDGKGKVCLSWEARSLAALPQEAGRPPVWMFAPTVSVSSGRLADFARNLNDVLKKAVSAGDKRQIHAALAGLDAAAKGKTEQEKQLQKIRFIRDHFAKAVLPTGPALNEVPFSCITPPAETLRSGYGNSADRAVLLAAALEYAKIPYRFVAATDIPALSAVQRKITQSPQDHFTSVLVYLPQFGIYLNDTGRFDPLGATAHAERLGLDLSGGRLQTIRPIRSGADRDMWNFQMKLEPDGDVSLSVTRHAYGKLAGTLREFYTHTRPERLNMHFQQMAANIRQGAVLAGKPELELSDPDRVTLRMQLQIPQYAAVEQDYIQFALPDLKRLAEKVRCGKAQRETPGYRSEPVRMELSYRIQLPAGVTVVAPRPRRMVRGGYSLRRYQETFEMFRNELQIGFSLTLPVELTEPLDYDRLALLERRLLDPATNHIILKKEKAK